MGREPGETRKKKGNRTHHRMVWVGRGCLKPHPAWPSTPPEMGHPQPVPEPHHLHNNHSQSWMVAQEALVSKRTLSIKCN